MKNLKKWSSSKIVNILFSLMLSLLIGAYVLSIKSGNSGSNNSSNSYKTLIPEKKATVTAPLTVQFDSTKYVIVGAPASVSVSLQGSAALVTATQSRNDIQAVADLRGLGAGQHTINVALTGVNSALTANSTPQTVTITLAEKSSAKRDVKVQYDSSKLASNYQVTDSTSDPKSVTITGPKDNVDAVAYVGADVALSKNTNSNVNQNAKLTAYDKNGDPVQVTISQQTAKVSMTVTNSAATKQVSLQAQASSGSLDGYNITFNPSTVTITGSSDKISGVNSIPVSVDVSNINGKTTTKTIGLNTPDGVDSISSPNVQVTISPK